MIPSKVIERLQANWPFVDSMQCNIECRLYTPQIEFYVYANDPDNIASFCYMGLTKTSYGTQMFLSEDDELLFNDMEYDADFVPMNALWYYKKLCRLYP